jgi:hypothetical protein
MERPRSLAAKGFGPICGFIFHVGGPAQRGTAEDTLVQASPGFGNINLPFAPVLA